jgi:hypothetical protein
MKICVVCRPSEELPQAFHLGGKRLTVAAVIDPWRDAGTSYYAVSVSDGRRFVLRHRPAIASWEPVAVCRSSP